MEINENNYFLLKNSGLKRVDIAKELGIPEWKLKKLITVNQWGKKVPTVSHKIFGTITQQSAYWAGFLAADGSVDTKNRVRVMLNYDDISHLEKYALFLNSTYKIQSNTDKYYRCALEFTSAEIVKDLSTIYNIVPNKSLILLPPSNLGSFKRDFIRGYFDGDGSICESFSNINSTTATLYATLVSGSATFTKWLEKWLDINGITYSTQHWENKSQIKMNTNQAKLFFSIIYKDVTENVRLSRKYAKYYTTVVENNRLTR